MKLSNKQINFIVGNCVYTISSETVIIIRGKPILKPDTIPKIFFANLPDYHPVPLPKNNHCLSDSPNNEFNL